ncbi:methyltransferase domain-containing protein [Streptomyces sp. NPDC050504]|uniref:methyltransferase domain-containing protein n=1 Tax=Streptomyces sp. NPDC050504 TaxID=3365618 RepID=UPI0037A0B959
MSAANAYELRSRCAAEIDAYESGHFHGRPWLREAFLAVPREAFVPDRVWWPHPREDGLCHVIDRATRPRAWLKAVYRPRSSLVTQVADGTVRPEDGPTDREFTSSISCSAVVVEMLHHLAPLPGEHILEIGTGTGYNTALMAHRVGARNVVSIEIDPALAVRAARTLTAQGVRATVVVGDGERGHPPGAPYDRIISTASIRRVPASWLDQLRPGGVLLAPLDTPFDCDGLLRLVADGHGTGRGRLLRGVAFMRVRGQRDGRTYGELGWPPSRAYPPGNWPAWQQYRVTAGRSGQRIVVEPRGPVAAR